MEWRRSGKENGSGGVTGGREWRRNRRKGVEEEWEEESGGGVGGREWRRNRRKEVWRRSGRKRVEEE